MMETVLLALWDQDDSLCRLLKDPFRRDDLKSCPHSDSAGQSAPGQVSSFLLPLFVLALLGKTFGKSSQMFLDCVGEG
jgi:hypothetical protein